MTGQNAGRRSLVERVLALGLLCGTGALLSCDSLTTDTNRGFVILQAQIPDIKDDGCGIPGDRTMTRLNSGTLDVAMDKPYPYLLYPLVKNLLTSLDNTGPEANQIAITSFEVTVNPPPGLGLSGTASCPLHYDYPLGATSILLPDDTAAHEVQALLPCHAAALAGVVPAGQEPIIQVSIKAKGRHGGSSIESADFTFPIKVCQGCLQQNFEGPYVNFSFPALPDCNLVLENPYRGNPCNVAQDVGPVLCCRMGDGTKPSECPARSRGTGTTM